MKTITAKELRDNLGRITEKVQQGEKFEVSYRSKAAMILYPPTTTESYYTGNEVGQRLDSIIKSLPNSIDSMMRESDKNFKELRNELYRRDPKYRRYLTPERIDE